MSIDAEKLAAVLRQRLAGFQELSTCRQLTGGASQELYQLRLRLAGEETLLALRRPASAQGPVEQVGSLGSEAEAALMSVMYGAGVAVPRIYYVLRKEDELGAGFIMQWLDGEALGARIVRSERFAEIRPQLAFLFGQALARIHLVDPYQVGLDTQLSLFTAEDLVHQSWDYYKSLDIAAPMIDFTARWLLERLPADDTIAVVHADYRNGNVMIDERGVVSILDWELAHLGDPVRDLGWLCVNSWRFGNGALPVGGFGTREQLLEGYKSVSGVDVDPEHLRFWEVFGSFWWAVACLKMAVSYRSGENSSPERPAIGRRSSEAQMDCANLIIPGDYFIPGYDADAAMKGELPLARELLGSIRNWLKNDMAGRLEARDRFLTHVAAHSLSIVERELTIGPQLRQLEHRLLVELMGEGGLMELRRRLTGQLRRDLPLDSAGLSAYLRQSVAGQLAIDQPEYSGLRVS